ncbi:MAG: L-cysteine/cystine lyase [Actinomycetota bacterium]|nr:L-cysteine/cystine lyase [Actinomycetota bacterium]
MSDPKLDAIREELPALRRGAFLNTGSFGPQPIRAHAALVTSDRADVEEGRMGHKVFERMLDSRARTRSVFAGVLGCDDSELALTHSTTSGVNIAVMGLDWQPGDRLITAQAEHPAELNPAAVLKQRRGVEVVATEVGLPGVDHVAALAAALDEGGARAVLLSHVCWTTGLVMPVRELADAAHQAGAVLIIDAAQGAGEVPVNVKDLDVDAYACSGQKWLCGPSGTGALYVRPDRMEDFQLTFAGYGAGKAARDCSTFDVTPGAARFEAITLHGPSLDALRVGLEWLQGDEVGLPWAHERIAALGRRCHEALSALPGVTTLAPAEGIAGLVSFTVAGMEPEKVTTALEEKGFFIRHVEFPAANRISTGFYNTEDEIDAVAEAIGELAGAG